MSSKRMQNGLHQFYGEVNSEMLYIRNQNLKLEKAIKIINQASHLMNGNEYDVSSLEVLKLAELLRCSAYDCEFVALAKDLAIPLIISDKKVLKAFPQYTTSLENYTL